MTNHRKLLEILLIVKDIDKTQFSEMMGKNRHNFSAQFKKDKLNEALLDEVCRVLETPRSYFDLDLDQFLVNQQAHNNIGSSVSQNVGTTENSSMKDLYERLLKEKDEVIKMLREKIDNK